MERDDNLEQEIELREAQAALEMAGLLAPFLVPIMLESGEIIHKQDLVLKAFQWWKAKRAK